VYYSPSGTFENTGTLTLDGQNSSSAVFVFQTSTTLTTDPNSKVLLKNGAKSQKVYWQIGSSATLGSGSQMAGTLLAQTAITLGHRAVINGRALAIDAEITLDENVICIPPTLACGIVCCGISYSCTSSGKSKCGLYLRSGGTLNSLKGTRAKGESVPSNSVKYFVSDSLAGIRVLQAIRITHLIIAVKHPMIGTALRFTVDYDFDHDGIFDRTDHFADFTISAANTYQTVKIASISSTGAALKKSMSNGVMRLGIAISASTPSSLSATVKVDATGWVAPPYM